MQIAEQTRTCFQKLWASVKPYCIAVRSRVVEFMETPHIEASASFQNGILNAFLTSMVLASPPMMYLLYMLGASSDWIREVPVWYGILVFTNVPENMMRKTRANVIFLFFCCLMYYLDYWGYIYAIVLIYFSRQKMKGKGFRAIMWQIRMEVECHCYIRTNLEFIKRLLDYENKVKAAIVKAETMIWNPDTFLLCCMVAFQWRHWLSAGYDINQRSWTMILSCKRAFFSLNLWRIPFFSVLHVVLHVAYFCVMFLRSWMYDVFVTWLYSERVEPEFVENTPKPPETDNVTEDEREFYEMWRIMALKKANETVN